MNTVTMLALSNNKKNKTRSILIMVSVFLTTVLLTVICTFAYGLVKLEKENAAHNYGSNYGIFHSVSTEQLKETERHGEFSKIGVTAQAGQLDNDAVYGLFMTDENYRDMSNLSGMLSEGRFPQKENEITAQKEFFEAAGYDNVQIGDFVTFSYRADLKHKFEPAEFQISGLLEVPDTDVPQTVFPGFVSQAFYEAHAVEDDRKYSVSFRLSQEVPITYDSAEKVIQDIAADCGIDKKYVSVNGIYLLLTLEPGKETMTVCAVIAAGVILFSVMVIYNIFQVGIVQNIREYGKIRALGASRKQMKKLIFQEGMLLAACSIPAGLLAGYAAAWASFQWLQAQGITMGEYEAQISIFSPGYLLLAAGMSLLTIILALRRPMKIVSSISPVEALRYMEKTGSRKAGIRKGRNQMSVWRLAAANIAADRRRTVMTIFTMGLSCVLFVVIANCAGNMDPEYNARNFVEIGQFQIELDYLTGDEAYPENNLDSVLEHNPLNKQLITQIQNINGVTGVQTRNLLLAETGGRQEDVEILDEAGFKARIQQGGTIGRLQYEDGRKQDLIYYGWSHFMEDYGYTLGQSVTLELNNGAETKSVTGEMPGAFGNSGGTWVITEDMYQKLNFNTDSPGWLWVDCSEEDVPAVRAELELLLNGTEHVEMTVFSDMLSQSRSGIRTMKIVCYLFLAVTGLIGFMNLANTMIISIITKKQEYGILQAVGMTNRQLNRSLQIQGFLFSAGTVLVALLVGLPAGYGFFCYAKQNALLGINVYHVPVAELVCMIAAVGLLQTLLSYLLSRNLKKESLVERIRYQE